jgi:hypothetical protein
MKWEMDVYMYNIQSVPEIYIRTLDANNPHTNRDRDIVLFI